MANKQIERFSLAAQPPSGHICVFLRAAYSSTVSKKKSVFCIHISLSNRDSFLNAHLGMEQGGEIYWGFFPVCLLKAIHFFHPSWADSRNLWGAF